MVSPYCCGCMSATQVLSVRCELYQTVVHWLQVISVPTAHTYRLNWPYAQLNYQIYRRIYRSQSISKRMTSPMHCCASLTVVLHPFPQGRAGWIAIAVTVSGISWKALALLSRCNLLGRPKRIIDKWNDAFAVWSLESSCFLEVQSKVWKYMF